jgi:hypothetical protein
LGLPTKFAFGEIFTEDDIQRELAMSKKRKNPPKSKVTKTPVEKDDEVVEEFVVNDDWENQSPFGYKKNGTNDGGEEVGANVTPRDLSGTDMTDLSKTRTPEIGRSSGTHFL